MKKKTETVIIRLEPELKEKLRLLAQEDDRPMATFMARLLSEYVDKHPEIMEKAVARDIKLE